MTATELVMVELHAGYGDGYGVVRVSDSGPVVNPARKVTHYTNGERNGERLDAWEVAILSAPSVDLVDGGVRVPPGAIKRVIGPLDGPDACRVRAKRFTKNWSDGRFADRATDAEIVAALVAAPDSGVNEATSIMRALAALENKYAS